jgi:hypothetical protein
MPCYNTGTALGDAELALGEKNIRITELTRLLCLQLTALEKTKNAKLIHGAVRPWWEEHKKIDHKRRAEAEAAMQQRQLAAKAVKKLTKAEHRALGVRT